MSSLSVLLAHVVSTITMLGVILVVQLVHYPLFAQVGDATFEAYQSEHMRRITWIVLPSMTVELATAVWLVVDPGLGLPAWQTWTGLALVGVIWASTGLLQVPQHTRLTSGFDAAAHRRLVASNWIRTAAWILRTALVTWMLAQML